MSTLEQNQNTDDLDDFQVQEVPKKSRKEMLKEKATQLGITFSPNIGEDALAKKIEAKLEGQNAEEALESIEATKELNSGKELTKAQYGALKRKEALKLIRVIVSPMDPLRAQLEGEIITAGNSVIGTVAKFIPFNAERGYHIPEILYKVLRDAKYMSHYTVKDSKGRDVNRQREAPAYNIQILPDLTEKELKRLAIDQRAREGRADYEE